VPVIQAAMAAVAAAAAVAAVAAEVTASIPVVKYPEADAEAQSSLDVKKALSCSALMPDAAAADNLLILNEIYNLLALQYGLLK
jgi:hypothetical protein